MIEFKTEEEKSTAYKKAFEHDDAGEFEEALKIRKALELSNPKHRWLLITLGKSYANLHQLDRAESYFRKAIELYPTLELAFLNLFHFLWDNDREDDAFEEIKRYQAIAHCEDYIEIVREINEKYGDDEEQYR